ncbi:group I truncated hemoglobin [Planctobacterium marinum]|uniref:group I truncated hemoglobin n=1 Tax=Planctobacterium marinum TaxID=1631968 RepID=UPI001E379C1A|nr:group 1 truncated hemoglobin [Planctobacterium marinum]MCC2607537.1 group 1 truncated hemoglobin [Planctobacterium marinum]
MKKILCTLLLLTIFGCASTSTSLYQQLGGAPKVAEIVDNFIAEIEGDEIMLSYFKGSDIGRFREKLNEHLCFLTGGGCQYTGDSMVDVHTGMNLNESDFNHGVDLFIAAMTRADIPHPLQNKVLAVMAPTRDEMLYLQ